VRATYSDEITLRGVLAALRGPRDAAGKPLLYGAMRTLHVAGVKHRFTRADDKLVDQLRAFMRPLAPWARREEPNLDVIGGITACTQVRFRDGLVCGRVAGTKEHACEECGIALCGHCCRNADESCEHMCHGCGRCCDEGDLATCECCASMRSYHPYFCRRCMWRCACGDCRAESDDEGDDEEERAPDGLCLNCAECVDEFVWCKGCGHRGSCCDQCAFEGGHMTFCWTGNGREPGLGCAECYCPECAEKHLTPYFEEEGDEEENAAGLLCPTCSRAVDPSAAALREKIRLCFSYSLESSDEDDDDDDESSR
jgi:hypothetical protein